MSGYHNFGSLELEQLSEHRRRCVVKWPSTTEADHGLAVSIGRVLFFRRVSPSAGCPKFRMQPSVFFQLLSRFVMRYGEYSPHFVAGAGALSLSFDHSRWINSVPLR